MPDLTNVVAVDLNTAVYHRVDVHEPLHQYDSGIVLSFTLPTSMPTFPAGTTCQFDTKQSTYIKAVNTTTNQVEVPDAVLGEWMVGDVTAHLHVSTNDYGVVIYDIHIPVVRRPKPNNYIDSDSTQTMASLISETLQTIFGVPSEDGMYWLVATKSGSTITYSWEEYDY